MSFALTPLLYKFNPAGACCCNAASEYKLLFISWNLSLCPFFGRTYACSFLGMVTGSLWVELIGEQWVLYGDRFDVTCECKSADPTKALVLVSWMEVGG